MAANPRPYAVAADDGLLDATNLRLLAELQDDARLSLAELGRRVGLSSPAVSDRLARLRDEGVITGYRAEIDPRRLGYTLCAHVRIRPLPRLLGVVADLIRQMPEVVECHRITGDDCYVATVWVRDVAHLEALIDDLAAHGQTTTSIRQSSPVPRRALGPPRRPED
jgi:Lrp/AsnC family leucine-responsive transcriptional regulator